MGRPKKIHPDALPPVISLAVIPSPDEPNLWVGLRVFSRGKIIEKIEQSEPNLREIIIQQFLDECGGARPNV